MASLLAAPLAEVCDVSTKRLFPISLLPFLLTVAPSNPSGDFSHGSVRREGLNLYDALGEFFAVEELGGDDCYRCERCKGLQVCVLPGQARPILSCIFCIALAVS